MPELLAEELLPAPLLPQHHQPEEEHGGVAEPQHRAAAGWRASVQAHATVLWVATAALTRVVEEPQTSEKDLEGPLVHRYIAVT